MRFGGVGLRHWLLGVFVAATASACSSTSQHTCTIELRFPVVVSIEAKSVTVPADECHVTEQKNLSFVLEPATAD